MSSCDSFVQPMQWKQFVQNGRGVHAAHVLYAVSVQHQQGRRHRDTRKDVPAIPLGSLCIHRDAPSHKPPINMPPQTFALIPLKKYLTRDSTSQRVYSPGAGFNPQEFSSPCDLPMFCCLATSVVWSVESLSIVRPVLPATGSTGCPSAGCVGPAWSSLTQDLHVSRRHESSIRTVHLPGTVACAAPQYRGCGLLCLVGLNSDLYRLCGSFNGLNTF